MIGASIPLPAGAELPRKIFALEGITRGAKLLFWHLSDWARQKRVVNPSVETLGRLLQTTPRSIRRHLAELERKGLVWRAYNGGRGRRCIYYVGQRAQKVAEETPTWGAAKHLGPLRLGRFALQRNPDKRIQVTADHSSRSEKVDRETKGSELPAGGDGMAADAGPKDDRPPTPLAGGAVGAWAAPESPASSSTAVGELAPPDAPATAQGASRTHVPPDPPRGGKASMNERSGGRRARLWECEPELWRAAWGLWRSLHRAIRRRDPAPDLLRDPNAMAGLIREALFAARQDRDEALRYLGWGFLKHLRGSSPHALWRCRRERNELGWPPRTWRLPTREQLAMAIARPDVSAGGGGPPSTSGGSKVDPARRSSPGDDNAPASPATDNAARAQALLETLKRKR